MADKILVLVSNPQGTKSLDINREIRVIQDALYQSSHSKLFKLEPRFYVRNDEIQDIISREEPRIVHFAGHGAGSKGLSVENNQGQIQFLNTEAFKDVLKLFDHQIECVVLNACYSEVQAQVIHQHINYVIGTKKEIQDRAAIAFSKGFYQALFRGEPIDRAFEQGRIQIGLEIYGNDQAGRQLVPVYSEEEKEIINRPQQEVLTILVKDPLNKIEKSEVVTAPSYISRKILHISLTEQDNDYASFVYFWDNPVDDKEHRLPLAEIKGLSDRDKTDDYKKIGQELYNWLDKSDRLLANVLQETHPEGLIIAISTDKGLAHLPWELLHDGKSFLVEKRPSIIPIRWVSNGKPIEIVNSPQNRPLNVLFMATSPLGVEPVFDYEAEEGQILEATKPTPLNLRVEESGCLTELSYMVREYEKGYFDIFHLTGHATHQEGKPYFVTEDEYGNRIYSRTNEIYDALKFKSSLPPLIFLSDCRTGYSSDGAVPSMAEELLHIGATAVISWGERVRGTDATAVSNKLYGDLAGGEILTQALSSTYKSMIDQQARDWHKLRLYVAGTLPEALVTPLKTKGRKRLIQQTKKKIEFRDDENRLRVASREEFVGRRRQLQNCLRTLKRDSEKVEVGVLLHGMGGWGKSSIASRLWDRLPEHEKILWWRQIDEFSLIKKLKGKLISSQTRKLITDLEDNQLELKYRLADLFSQLSELGEKPFLFILDDFEWNLEPREDRYYILKPKVAPILKALVEAIQETGTENKIIITCRYEFDSELLEFFFSQGLEPLRKAELTKKLNRLEHFSSDNLSEDICSRALNLADGNPRLLEFLNNDILGREDTETKLTELEQSPELWKDKIIWEELSQLIDEPLQQVLSYCLVYEIPAPMIALEAVCDSLPNYQKQLQRGRELGLIAVSAEASEENRVYCVPRILPHIIPTIRLPEAPKVYSLYHKAHDKLYQLWGNKENESEEKWGEIFRLLFADKDNPLRFRQGFSQMLSVQYNAEADRAFEAELRRLKDELSEENLYAHLEEYLKNKEWRKADEETAWLFFLVMVQQGYRQGWHELCQEFPSEIFNEIDQLWVKYSQGRFGFSIQKCIWKSVEKSKNDNTIRKFVKKVQWREGSVSNNGDPRTPDPRTPNGHLPYLPYIRGVRGGFGGFSVQSYVNGSLLGIRSYSRGFPGYIAFSGGRGFDISLLFHQDLHLTGIHDVEVTVMLNKEQVLERLSRSKDGETRCLWGLNIGDVDFSGQVFEHPVDFSGARFVGSVDFTEVVFKYEVNFYRVIFFKRANFSSCEFQASVYFWIAEFHEEACFLESSFIGQVKFWETRFYKKSNFSYISVFPKGGKVSYDGEANFSWTWFLDEVAFTGAKFHGPVIFWRTLFKTDVLLDQCKFFDEVTFEGQKNKVHFPRNLLSKKTIRTLFSQKIFLYEEADDPGNFVSFNEAIESVNDLNSRLDEIDDTYLSQNEKKLLIDVWEEGSRQMFPQDGRVSFRATTFEKKDETKFSSVNLNNAFLGSSNISSVKLVNVKWDFCSLEPSSLLDNSGSAETETDSRTDDERRVREGCNQK